MIAALSNTLPFTKGCDIFEYASLDYVTPEPGQLQKLQARTQARRASSDLPMHNTSSKYSFLLYTFQRGIVI